MSCIENAESFVFDNFNNIVLNVAEDYLILKTNVKTYEDFERWKNIYCDKFKTSLNVAFTYNTKKADFHRRYKCIFGEKRHKGKRKTFLGCPFTLNVKIKKITENELKRDEQLRDYPCFIKIQGKHKNCTESADTLRQLRILPDTKEEFLRYFSLGMNPRQAARFHEEKFDLNLEMIANASINPTYRVVEYLHDCWIEQHHGTVGGTAMFQSIKAYAEKNKTSIIDVDGNEDEFTVVLITDFMLRAHQALKEASEVVFVDTTSHVDVINTSITILLCSGPAGAVPLGVIFSSSQSTAAYEKGFAMLRNALGAKGFYGKGSPENFVTDNSDPERQALQQVWPNAQLFLCIFHILQQVWRWLCDSNHCIAKEHRKSLMQIARDLVYATDATQFDAIWMTFAKSKLGDKYSQYKRCSVQDDNLCAYSPSSIMGFAVNGGL